MSDTLHGWEFTDRRTAIQAHIPALDGLRFCVTLWNDGVVDTEDAYKLATLRAVLDELERRARAKWGDGWGLPPGTCPRCKGSGMIHSREIVTHVMRLDDPDFAPPQSGYRVDPCPECSTYEKAPAASSDRG